MDPESAAETGARVAEALNLLALVASPEGLVRLRETKSDQQIRGALEEALRTCLTFFRAVTLPVPGVDLTQVNERLTALLESPALLDLRDPASLSEVLRATLAAIGCPVE